MGDPADERIHRAGAAGRTDKMIGNARRVENPLRRSRARFPFLSPTVTSSPGAGEVFPLRGSQGLRPIAEGLKYNEKVSRSALASPFGRGVTAGDGEGARRCPRC